MSGGSEFEVLFIHFTITTEYVLIIFGGTLCLILMRMMISRYKINFLPESALIILFGIVCGLIAWLSSKVDRHTLMSFDYDIFFLIFIPPIILEAGYFLQKHFFFQNLRLIILYAVFGTILNSFFTGISLYLFRSFFPIEISLVEFLTFGSLISAVDPVAVLAIFEEAHVNETLHIIVSGESILNDSVSIVLFQLFVNLTKVSHITTSIPFLALVRFFLVSFGGVLFGVSMGLLGSWVTKFTNVLQLFEPVVLMCVGFLSYQLAEVLSLSGIVSILFCGITLSRYADTNMGRRSSLTFKRDLKSFASMSEAIIFLYLGFEMTFQFTSKDSTNEQAHDFSLLFTCLTLFFILFYRFVIIFILTLFANRSRITKVKLKEQLILSYSGLRGAIAFALAFSLPDSITAKNCFISTTLIVVLFTVFIQGGTIKPIMKRLHLKFAKKENNDPKCSNKILPIVFLHLQNAMFSIIGGTSGAYSWSHKFQDLDHFLQQFFVRGLFKEEKDFLTVLNQLKEAEVKEELDEREKRRLLVDQAKFSQLVSNPNVRLERVMQEKNRRLTEHVAFNPSQRQNRLRRKHQLNINTSDLSSQTDLSSQSELFDLSQSNSLNIVNRKNDIILRRRKMKKRRKKRKRKSKRKKSLYKNRLTAKKSDPLFSSFGSQTDLELRSKFSKKDLSKVVCKLQTEHNLSNLNRLVPYSRVNEPSHQYDLDVNTLPVLVRRGHILKQNLTTNVLGNVRRNKHLTRRENHNKIHRNGYKAINYNYLLSNNVSKHMMPSNEFISRKKSNSNSSSFEDSSSEKSLTENYYSPNLNQKKREKLNTLTPSRINNSTKLIEKKNQINVNQNSSHRSKSQKRHHKHHHRKHHHKHRHRPHTSHRFNPSIEIKRFKKVENNKKNERKNELHLKNENYNINKEEEKPFINSNESENSLDKGIIVDEIPKFEKKKKGKRFKKKISQGFEIEIESDNQELPKFNNTKKISQKNKTLPNQKILVSSGSTSEN
ncbi:sodium/hydrogen exchanger [Anaeramoeba flamelloides]|uniref:Sodium/hydrogen exchanger n=1 Tax=Anaeramoeba flamelloides TaxID=1746091 RepID=A0AAV7ZVQ7_9EUKA|nr:sodium/hydrogen exchanger [Anaeramoeba flamelloides]